MTRLIRLFAFTAIVLSLSGCVTREQADANLAKGCMAAVNALITGGYQVTQVKSTEANNSSEEGPDVRSVTIKTSTKDGWIEEDRDYRCLFEESFGLFNMNHTASIYQVKVNGQVYGKMGRELVGSVDDFVKLTDAVRKAMYE